MENLIKILQLGNLYQESDEGKAEFFNKVVKSLSNRIDKSELTACINDACLKNAELLCCTDRILYQVYVLYKNKPFIRLRKLETIQNQLSDEEEMLLSQEISLQLAVDYCLFKYLMLGYGDADMFKKEMTNLLKA